MGAPIGTFSFRHAFILKFLKGKHQGFYNNTEILDGLQWQQSMCSISGGAKRLTHLLRTAPRAVWTHCSGKPGSKSLLEMAHDISATNLESMYKMTSQELSKRVQEQLRFSSPMGSLGEEDIERIMDAAHVAGFLTAVTGFAKYIPDNAPVRNIDVDRKATRQSRWGGLGLLGIRANDDVINSVTAVQSAWKRCTVFRNLHRQKP